MRFSILVNPSSLLWTGPRCLDVDLSWPFNLGILLASQNPPLQKSRRLRNFIPTPYGLSMWCSSSMARPPLPLHLHESSVSACAPRRLQQHLQHRTVACTTWLPRALQTGFPSFFSAALPSFHLFCPTRTTQLGHGLPDCRLET